MNFVEGIQGCCLLEWGSLSEWFTGAVLIVGLVITFDQLRHNKTVREMENSIEISRRVVKHNSLVEKDPSVRDALQFCEGLNAPKAPVPTAATPPSPADRYWAMRGLHLSHINLVWQVWQLLGRPEKWYRLGQDGDGWERFAKIVIMEQLLKAKKNVEAKGPDKSDPEDLAGNDVLDGLRKYEVVPMRFVAWLDELTKQVN